MPGMWQKTMVYLGLTDDEEGYEYDYDELSLDEEPAEAAYERYERPERVERPERPREPAAVVAQRRVRADPVDEPAQISDSATPQIRPMAATSARVHVVAPHGFNDAQEV